MLKGFNNTAEILFLLFRADNRNSNVKQKIIFEEQAAESLFLPMNSLAILLNYSGEIRDKSKHYRPNLTALCFAKALALAGSYRLYLLVFTWFFNLGGAYYPGLFKLFILSERYFPMM
ncbi:hypothetical protein [Hymenobacter arcticus]